MTTIQPDPTQPTPDPLAYPGTTAILLSEAASRRLLLEGNEFAIVARGSYPCWPNRIVIYCSVLDPDVKRDLGLILAGTHIARPKPKPRPMLPAPPPEPAAGDQEVELHNLDYLSEPNDQDMI